MTNNNSDASNADAHGNNPKPMETHNLRAGNAGLPPPPLGLRSPMGKPHRRALPHKLARPIDQARVTKPSALDNQQLAAQDQPWLFQSANFRPLPLPLALLAPDTSSQAAAASTGDDDLSLLVPLASAYTLTTSCR